MSKKSKRPFERDQEFAKAYKRASYGLQEFFQEDFEKISRKRKIPHPATCIWEWDDQHQVNPFGDGWILVRKLPMFRERDAADVVVKFSRSV